MNLRILTEADYLRAHVTEIVADRRARTLTFGNLRHLVMAIFKKYVAAPMQNRG